MLILPLVDEVIELDAKSRAVKTEADSLRANRNKVSKEIGALMAQGKKEEAMEKKALVQKNAERLAELEAPTAEEPSEDVQDEDTDQDEEPAFRISM